jgi:hypothetical protein
VNGGWVNILQGGATCRSTQYDTGSERIIAGKQSYVSEGLTAESVDAATLLVQGRLDQPFFAVDSDGYGRVLINRSNIRFCSILPAVSAEAAAVRSQVGERSDIHADVMSRAAAVVDADIRRY